MYKEKIISKNHLITILNAIEKRKFSSCPKDEKDIIISEKQYEKYIHKMKSTNTVFCVYGKLIFSIFSLSSGESINQFFHIFCQSVSVRETQKEGSSARVNPNGQNQNKFYKQKRKVDKKHVKVFRQKCESIADVECAFQGCYMSGILGQCTFSDWFKVLIFCCFCFDFYLLCFGFQ